MIADDPGAPYARLAVVGLIREPGEGRWLLTRAPRTDEIWAPPGGRLEREESLVQATEREMLEEVGLRVEVAGPCYAYVTMHKGERTVAVSMACRVAEPAPAPVLEPREALDARWVTVEEWAALASAGLTLWATADILRATTLAQTLLAIDAG
ncbi:MAG: NUDIX hydrolase [Thermoleophilia bacterium]|nr:NUDIX hydrolase [Thermoleophilia bacterium]